MHDKGRTNVRWGIKWGLYVAAVSSVIALTAAGTDPNVRSNEVAALLILYFASGICAGAVIGLLRNQLSSIRGSIFAGIIASIPVAGGLCMLAWGMPWRWSSGKFALWLVLSVYMGALIPIMLRIARRLQKDPP